jgi:NAD+ diphosphatase
MLQHHFYSSEYIDRAVVQRRDEAWVNQRLGSESTLFVPVWRGKIFVDRAEPEGDAEYRLSGRLDAPAAPDRRLKAIFLRSDETMPLLDGHRRAVLLGCSGPRTYFALDLSDLGDASKHRLLAGRGDFVGLRRVGPMLDRFDGGLLAYARGMLRWHQQHAYCGVCGSHTVMLEAGFIRRCTDAECGQQHFPRTDPAIIVLVTHGDRALLGRQAKWDTTWYSVLAGFVEPGETLEQAVRREVKEEAGINVGEVHYDSSQPWPFPSSLMIGFIAQALDDDIHIHDKELEDARWFTREDVDAGIEAGELRLSPRISISRHLIESWRLAGAEESIPLGKKT